MKKPSKRRKRGTKKVLAVLLILSICFSTMNIEAMAEEELPVTQTDNFWDGVTMESIYEGNGFQVKFQLESCWDGGFNAKVRIDNTGELEIKNW